MNRFRLALLLVLTAGPAFADSSHIALHATSGSTTVTVFTAPDPLAPGPAEISILIQSREQAAGATAVDASLSSADASQHLELQQTGALLTARTTLPRTGTYQLSLHIARAGALPVDFNARLDVQPDNDRQTTVIFGVLLPLAIIALFLVNQQLKARRRRPA